MTLIELARKLRPYIELAAKSLADEDAVEAKEMFPTYKCLVDDKAKVEKGFRFRYEDKLYRVEQPIFTFDGVYAPGPGTESLFSEVVLPGEGTEDNAPIPYSGNMELTEGLFYTQGGVVYRCIRSTGVPVYHNLTDLVGLYVEVAE